MPNTQAKRTKFTRGEKCLFFHLIATFSLILLMILVYFVHLCIVNHTRTEIFKIYRRAHERLSALDVSDYQSIGVIYLNVTPTRIVCNALLLHERWSLAPAQCTSMREDPDMAYYLLHWKIKFKINGKYRQSDIKRTLSHSHFSRSDYHNNIGLFEHVDPIHIDEYYVVPKDIILNDDIFQKNSKQMAIVDWELDYTKKGYFSDAVVSAARPIPLEKCSTYASPIAELRNYEFCVTFEINGPTVDHGAMFVFNSKIIGFFSWGDIKGREYYSEVISKVSDAFHGPEVLSDALKLIKNMI